MIPKSQKTTILKKNRNGQVMVETVILLFAVILVFQAIVIPLCVELDSFVQGIYFVLQAPFP